MSEVEVRPMPFEGNNPGPSTNARESESNSPSIADSSEILKMLSDPNQMFAAALDGPKSQLERLLAAGFEDASFPADGSSLLAFDLSPFGTLRNTSKTLKCPKCNWHYKYQETLEIHMKEKHADVDVKCVYCVENRQHPKLARGESYSCGYKPYRCELCKYSTTTKGNLSIHMQSDKHLHAMQELPNNIANFSCPPLSRCSPIQENDSNFMCLVCGAFSTDSPREFVEHAEKDRSRPSQGDVSVCGGTFRCHLCPYSTTLKANFQLHTRTDKHIQKVQTANHIREGASGQSALYRLASTKSVFQVLCKSCQEVLSSATSLREHCESASHRQQLRKGIVIFSCKLCPFESPSTTDAIGHMTCHEPSTWPLEMIEDSATLEAHAKSHEAGDQCPLCPDRSPSLIQHLIHEHKIAESAVDRLLAVHRPPSDGSSGFAFRCAQCSMAFRSEASLQSHSIVHLFATTHKCSTCDKVYADADKLKVHISEEHPRNVGGDGDEQRCELCFESFPSPAAIAAHNNSARHLHKAKQHLEKGSVDLSAQVFGVLQKPSSPGSDKSKKFRCNVCNQHYGQGATLDIHLRSVAHQTRMGRVAELVANGEIDASLAVVEQPGGPPQALIKDLIRKDDEPASRQMSVMDMMNMFLAPKIFPDASSGETTPPEEATTTTSSDEPSTSSNVPRTGIQLLSQIQVYGEDKLIGLVPSLLGRMRAIAAFDEATVAALNKFDCDECGETLHGVLALNLHYEEAHSANIPNDVLRNFGERLSVALSEFDDCDQATNGSASPKFRTNGEEYSGERPEKRQRGESSSHSEGAKQPDLTQLAMFSMMGFPFMPAGAMGGFMSPAMSEMFPMMHNAAAMASSPAKRARTRITDDQLKILRQYFDINNSPTEAHIKEMSLKAGLPEKVIKHWFRNTLFKERQRDKDSPYNFSIPPQMSIDLDAYERTGETKVVTLSNEPKLEPSLSSSSLVSIASPSTAPEEKKVVQPLTPVTAEPAASLPTTPLNLQAMLSQMHANSFPFMDAASFMGAGSIPQMAQQSTSSGRRANRTRFTDFQLRTLQTFFDRQAYPKDDDLEILSKKLQLSPRVIVVWFQNARQKARKIYENQPNHENSDRFVRTPGSNFQCKRCSQVFQRYYELIQHQQKKCYKDDGAALVNDNKSVEESLTEEEKLVTQAAMPSVSDLKIPADFLKLLGNSKSNTDVLLKMCETVGTSTATTVAFYKRCPFCGVSFRCRKTMGEHLQTKHAQQMLLTHIDLDLLPNVEEVHVPSFLSADSRDIANAALDLSGSSSQDYSRESLSMSPHPGHSDDDVMTEALEDSPFANFPAAVLSSTGGSHSPANNKRYRTHLTPIQVHVMKNVFAEYKTPSMAECEMLGHEIGLHKRVVQVWFQNARAKERKTRPPNAEEEQKPAQSSCLVCGVEYGGRISMQDHLFSAEHINRLKVQLKSEGISEMSTAGGEAEKRARPSSQTPTSSAAALNLSSFPFSLVNNMLAGNLPFIDVNIFGTPITMLQIPEAVKLQITSDIASTTIHSTTFTQDGESIETLRELLSDEEKELVQAKDKEVGWACPSCSNVFQELSKLKEHQRTICQNCDSTFTLVQTHYECSLCGVQVGMQKDYVSHTTSAMHQKACGARQQLSSQI